MNNVGVHYIFKGDIYTSLKIVPLKINFVIYSDSFESFLQAFL